MPKMVFDAGAHTGEEIPSWIRHGYDKIVAIEPLADLCEKISKQYPDVIVVNAALWKNDGKHEMYFGGYTSLATLQKQRTKSGRFKNYGWGNTQIVETITLDTLIERYGVPELIKMDIEGAELEALQGLSVPVDNVSFEYVSEEIERALQCCEQLCKLGEYRFIIRTGESTSIAHNQTLEQVSGRLLELSKDIKIWGMVTAIKEIIE